MEATAVARAVEAEWCSPSHRFKRGPADSRAMGPEYDFDLDDVFLETVSSSNLMEVEFGEDGDVDSFRIDPRVLRSVLALYSAQERTRHDWR